MAWGVRLQHVSLCSCKEIPTAHIESVAFGGKQLNTAQSEISVITAIGLDWSLTPRSLGGQSGTREGMLASIPPEPPTHSLPLLAFPWSAVTVRTSPSLDAMPHPPTPLPPPPPEWYRPSSQQILGTSLSGPHSSFPCSPSPVHTKDSFRN